MKMKKRSAIICGVLAGTVALGGGIAVFLNVQSADDIENTTEIATPCDADADKTTAELVAEVLTDNKTNPDTSAEESKYDTDKADADKEDKTYANNVQGLDDKLEQTTTETPKPQVTTEKPKDTAETPKPATTEASKPEVTTEAPKLENTTEASKPATTEAITEAKKEPKMVWHEPVYKTVVEEVPVYKEVEIMETVYCEQCNSCKQLLYGQAEVDAHFSNGHGGGYRSYEYQRGTGEYKTVVWDFETVEKEVLVQEGYWEEVYE